MSPIIEQRLLNPPDLSHRESNKRDPVILRPLIGKGKNIGFQRGTKGDHRTVDSQSAAQLVSRGECRQRPIFPPFKYGLAMGPQFDIGQLCITVDHPDFRALPKGIRHP